MNTNVSAPVAPVNTGPLNVYRGSYIDFSNVWTLGTKEEIGDRLKYPKNLLEKAGDVGMWIVEGLPRKIWPFISDPKVVSTAITVFALLLNSLIFYPSKTARIVKTVISMIDIPFWAVRLATYIVTSELIVATYLRAQGRFLNSKLMEEFNSKFITEQVKKQVGQ